MAYFEMVLLVLVALAALVLLALAASSGPVSHLHATHSRSRPTGGTASRHRSRRPLTGTVPRSVAPDHVSLRGADRAGDWSRLMESAGPWRADAPGPRATTLEAER